MSELWAKWEGEVIDGGLPLRRLVGVSDHSGVFLTEAPAYDLPNAAVKLVPVIPTLAESQLAHWKAAAGLLHPRLLRLYALGRCQLGNLQFLYVLMEYADQNLAQLLEARALTDVEARETLPPTLDALAFLHSKNVVQGQLKPSNILVVGDQLKLASDTIRPAGELATSISMSSQYDPPEGRDGSTSTAGDIWALGVTLYEALTRATPEKPDERSHGVVLPADFPPMMADIVKECLSRRPPDRPSVTGLQDWVSGKVRYRGAPSPSAVAAESGVAAGVADRRALASAGTADPGVRGGAAINAGVASDSSARGGGPARVGAAAADSGARSGVAANAGAGADSGSRGSGSTRGGGVAADVGVRGGVAANAGAGADSRVRGGVAPATTRATDAFANASAADIARARIGVSADLAPTDRIVPQAAAFSPATAAQPGAAGSPAESNAGRLTIRAVLEREPLEEEAPPGRSYLPWAVAAIAILAVGWGAIRFLGSHSSASPSPTNAESSTTANQPAPQSGDPQAQAAPGSQAPRSAPSEPPQAQPPGGSEDRSHRHSARGDNPTSRGGAASDAGPGSVAHEEIPVVPRSALATIRGRIKIVVRVTADESGNVISDNLDRPGPSHYFSRLATQAARKWKFVPDGHKSGAVWEIHFEFARTGVTAHATGSKS